MEDPGRKPPKTKTTSAYLDQAMMITCCNLGKNPSASSIPKLDCITEMLSLLSLNDHKIAIVGIFIGYCSF